MIFSSLYFLFVFLPISLILYFVTPKRFRNVTLVLISLVFYAWGTPEYIVLMLFSVLLNYFSGLEIQSFQEAEKPRAALVTMIIAVVGDLLLLGFFKYYGFLISNLNAVTGLSLRSPELTLPLGISFYTFTVLSYIFDVYRKRTQAQKNIITFAAYVTFFPKVISGPIVQYGDMEAQLSTRQMAPAKFGAGLNLFLVGLFKKVLLSDNLGTAFTAISGLTTMSVGTAWLGMVLYSFELYFDFSGYSDMAIGLAKMFGFDLEKNFDYPYLSSSISEFWRRWHISLGTWFRQYVYIPLGGNRCSKWKNLRNLAVVWLLTGLWHGASWNFILWGIYHGAFVILEKFVIKDKKLPKPLGVAGTVFLVFFGWVLFFSPSLGSALHYYGQMFGLGHLGLIDSTCRYYLSGNLLLLILSIVGCGPIVKTLHQKLCYWKGGAMTYVSAACYLVLLVLTVAYLVSSTYTSFLYVQF
jgi:alginate O-acetyltransferase complex protein AlgI